MRIGIGIVICGLTTGAWADAKIVGVGGCQLAGGGTGGLSYLAGGVQNTSGTTKLVVCSLMRDNGNNRNGLRDLEVSVTDSTGSLLCDAISEDRAGNPLKIVRRAVAGTGSQILDWKSSLNVSAPRGHYAILCTVPNDAIIHSVYFEEP